jgi:hypothetical protein
MIFAGQSITPQTVGDDERQGQPMDDNPCFETHKEGNIWDGWDDGFRETAKDEPLDIIIQQISRCPHCKEKIRLNYRTTGITFKHDDDRWLVRLFRWATALLTGGMMTEQTNQGASKLRERYWEKFGKPPDGPGPHPDRGGPAYIPWLELLVTQLEAEIGVLRDYATHKPGCHEGGEDCLCGLDALLTRGNDG